MIKRKVELDSVKLDSDYESDFWLLISGSRNIRAKNKIFFLFIEEILLQQTLYTHFLSTSSQICETQRA